MKKFVLLLLASALTVVAAEQCPMTEKCPVTKFNELGYGTISGRVQSLTMNRNWDTTDGWNSSLGLELRYLSPEFAGFDFGVTYDVAAELWKESNSGLMANDDINTLNEAWLRYHVTTNLSVTAGRKVNNGEVFRADCFRQMSRSLEAVQIDYTGIKDLKLTLGHAIRMSNWVQAGDRWDFNDFGNVPGFGNGDETDGITWGEAVYTGVDGLEVALFDAYAYDVANLIGTRVKWNVADNTALLGYYRHESEVGASTSGDSDAFGLSLQQKVGDVTLEPGYFGVRGDDLRFQETTTGINHSLGSLMMIYGSPFAGDSDTAYFKVSTTLPKTKTFLYGLYAYTWNDSQAFDGQELNVVVKQPICDRLSVAVKLGVGYRDLTDGTSSVATDSRLFVTYNF
jgi:hypothetical protein